MGLTPHRDKPTMDKVQVLALTSHFERARRAKGDTYYVTAERFEVLQTLPRYKGWVEAVEVVKAREAAEVKIEEEAKEAEVKQVEDELATTDLDELMQRWDMKVSPEKYLERWPEGDKAALAKEIVDKIADG